jgi:flagellar motor switch protein FliG
VAATEHKHLSGKTKAAILLATLGADAAAEIMKRLRDREVETLTLEITRQSRISQATRRLVLDEFSELVGSAEVSGDGGVDYAREILVKIKGEDEATNILEKIEEVMNEPGFEGLNDVESAQLVHIIRNERPQTIALILAHLKPALSGTVLAALPREVQADVTRRMARFNRVSVEMLKDVEHVLNQSFFLQGGGQSEVGGPKAVAEILNRMDPTTEKHILGTLEATDPDLVTDIRKHMFVFEDISVLGDRDVQRLLKEVETKTLALAMKAASDRIKELVFKNMSARAQEMLKEEIEMMGPVRLRVVEEAQSEIVDAVRRLEDSGEITIERAAEEEDVYV